MVMQYCVGDYETGTETGNAQVPWKSLHAHFYLLSVYINMPSSALKVIHIHFEVTGPWIFMSSGYRKIHVTLTVVKMPRQ